MNKEYLRKVGLSLSSAAKRGDAPAVAKWATRALVAVTPEPEPELEVVDPTDVPNVGKSKKLSTVLYSPWAFAWFAASFGTVWPDAATIAEKATKDGCLAQVCAAGILGVPGDPGDWHLFTGIVSTGEQGAFIHRVYEMGELIGTSDLTGPDKGLEFAKSLGLDVTQ